MRALFIKDLHYMRTQKSFILLVILIGIVMALTQNDNYIFVIGYMTFMGLITSMMSVTMDDQNHGFAFLFSLPIDRKKYVTEKYIFTLLASVVFSLFSSACCLFFRGFADYKAPFEEICTTCAGTLVFALLFVCFMMPLTLKFGAERARIASFISIGLFFAFVVIVAGLVQLFGAGTLSNDIINLFTSARVGILIAIGSLWLLLCLFISHRISLRLLEKREF